MTFVFASNLDGRHGAGSARYAYLHHHAELGVGEGPTGDSYALPTVGHKLARMPLYEVVEHVDKFLAYASGNPQDEFQVTCIGCGLAGFKDSEIAPLFSSAPSNCLFDTKWRKFLPSSFRFWGTF